MSHHVYTTPGFVIDSRPNGEAGKLMYIFTRDLGLVMAAAQGVRLGVSKLRYHTQDYAYSVFSLVRGKELWRLTGAGPVEGAPIGQAFDSAHFLRARIFALLRRLLHGEEANPELFAILESFELFISEKHDRATAEVIFNSGELIECIVVLRVLHALGYVEHGSAENSSLEQFLSDGKIWTVELIDEMKGTRALAVKAINAGLKESQL